MDNSKNEVGDLYNNTDSVSQKNKNEFASVMSNAAIKKDDYLDSNSKVVRIILLILGVIMIVGIAYYLILWFTNK